MKKTYTELCADIMANVPNEGNICYDPETALYETTDAMDRLYDMQVRAKADWHKQCIQTHINECARIMAIAEMEIEYRLQ